MKKAPRRRGPKGVYCSNPDYRYAVTHLLSAFWGAKNLDDLKTAVRALNHAVKACGATFLKIMLHHFTPFGGISGVAVIQESHISIHIERVSLCLVSSRSW